MRGVLTKWLAFAGVLGLVIGGLFLLESVPTAGAATKPVFSPSAAQAIANARTLAANLQANGASSLVKGTLPVVGSVNPGAQALNNQATGVSPRFTAPAVQPKLTVGGIQFCTVTFEPFKGLNLTIGSFHIVIPPIFVTLSVPCFISGIFR